MKNLLSTEKLTRAQQVTQVYKILIFTWKFEFYHWQQTSSVVFLDLTGLLCSFSRKMIAKYLSLNNYSLSTNHSYKQKRCFIQNVASFTGNSGRKRKVTKVSPLDKECTLDNVAKVFVAYFLCHHTKY